MFKKVAWNPTAGAKEERRNGIKGVYSCVFYPSRRLLGGLFWFKHCNWGLDEIPKGQACHVRKRILYDFEWLRGCADSFPSCPQSCASPLVFMNVIGHAFLHLRRQSAFSLCFVERHRTASDGVPWFSCANTKQIKCKDGVQRSICRSIIITSAQTLIAPDQKAFAPPSPPPLLINERHDNHITPALASRSQQPSIPFHAFSVCPFSPPAYSSLTPALSK